MGGGGGGNDDDDGADNDDIHGDYDGDKEALNNR